MSVSVVLGYFCFGFVAWYATRVMHQALLKLPKVLLK